MVVINGFRRIGRNFLQCWHGRKNSPLDVIVVNDNEVKILDNETITVNDKPIKVVSNRDPLKPPWVELGIDIMIEESLWLALELGNLYNASAKKVIITAPAKGADSLTTYVVGVNEGDYSHKVANIVSNASCTTNCLAPFVKVMDAELGKRSFIFSGTMTTTYSYTGDQTLRCFTLRLEVSQGCSIKHCPNKHWCYQGCVSYATPAQGKAQWQCTPSISSSRQNYKIIPFARIMTKVDEVKVKGFGIRT
ncbi:hypothetical protein L1049_002293 [Liquidambar formosana]|uniref:Glyceraldehyde 3-phosphate dehydrogenase NAD(P) binding domain-containing protein n=1 Tax=Liquidambar formosana TaxID=63359 RepID=A0AAP0NH22_LIQFO